MALRDSGHVGKRSPGDPSNASSFPRGSGQTVLDGLLIVTIRPKNLSEVTSFYMKGRLGTQTLRPDPEAARHTKEDVSRVCGRAVDVEVGVSRLAEHRKRKRVTAIQRKSAGCDASSRKPFGPRSSALLTL